MATGILGFSLHVMCSGPLLLCETEHVRVSQKIGALKIMKHSERLDILERVRAEHSVFLLSVLWKLTGEREGAFHLNLKEIT